MESKIQECIKQLYKFNRCLLGNGYDNAIEYLKQLLDLKILEIPSGTIFGTWKVPQEWVVKDAWVKYKEKKIFDYKKNPLCLVVGSIPIKETLSLEDLEKYLYVSDERTEAIPYEYKFYDKGWGFCMPKYIVKKRKKSTLNIPNKLKKGKYEVFIDTEYRDGKMKIAEHIIQGKSDREILLFAHLDHPFQANDNLSGVVCLVDLAHKIKDKFNHTIKIIFCPETIGSIAYAYLTNLSKVDFMVALDIVGNDNSLLLQKSFDENNILNYRAHLAITHQSKDYRKGQFRLLLGSEEYIFNDPKIGIPAILFSRFPYPEYHTSDDTPEIIKEEKIKEVQDTIITLIDIWEKDYVPFRNFVGPLMRSKFGVQTGEKRFNRELDYFFYLMDGKRTLAQLCCETGKNFYWMYDLLEKLKNENLITPLG